VLCHYTEYLSLPRYVNANCAKLDGWLSYKNAHVSYPDIFSLTVSVKYTYFEVLLEVSSLLRCEVSILCPI
jgi:hypothetical protein